MSEPPFVGLPSTITDGTCAYARGIDTAACGQPATTHVVGLAEGWGWVSLDIPHRTELARVSDERLCIHPHITRRWWRWYPWLQIRPRNHSIVLRPTWRRAEAERLAAFAARIYANSVTLRGYEPIKFDVTTMAGLTDEALHAPRFARWRTVRIWTVLGVILICIAAIPARYAWCEAHGGHLTGGTTVNSQGRIGGMASCTGAK